MKTVAIIPAAGSGNRMGAQVPKQFLDLEGVPLLAMTLQAFQQCDAVDAVILVVPPKEADYCRKVIINPYGLDKVQKVVAGGRRRQDSVRRGLAATEGAYDLILIHDGARPFVDASLISRMVSAGKSHRAAVAGLPARDTVKIINSQKEVVHTPDRKDVWLVQTPQVFRYKDIVEAHRKAQRWDGEEATDDSVLVEKLGIPVKMVEGSEKNIKVTTPRDLELARFFVQRRARKEAPIE